MKKVLLEILDWSEVWALFIPIIILAFKKKQPKYLTPIIIYIFCALYLNFIIDIIWKYKKAFYFPQWFSTNNYIYNIHSIIRLVLFSLFFIRLKQDFLQGVKKVLPILFLIGAAINFTFFEDFFNYRLFSSTLLATEAALLLFYCLQYYLYKLIKEDEHFSRRQPDFWVVTGLSIYVAVNFILFLFHDNLTTNYKAFSVYIWKVQDVSYIFLCIFIAKAFYESRE